jgi:hypothetical protein
MVRKAGNNGNALSSRQSQSQAPTTNSMVPVGIVGVGGNGINSVLKLFGKFPIQLKNKYVNNLECLTNNENNLLF